MKKEVVAYFSMEVGLEAAVPTYSGGLGVLAGDTLRAASDMGLPIVGVTLLNRKGYFHQTISKDGAQEEAPVVWEPKRHLRELSQRVSVEIAGRRVMLRVWQFDVRGVEGALVPVYFLDSDLPENESQDRNLTDHLYGGDALYRLSQEIVLGIGGVRMLRALGYHQVRRFHMNEGHSSLLTLELLAERLNISGRQLVNPEDKEALRELCVFTTHTPVAAGHDQFDWTMAFETIARPELSSIKESICQGDRLNMTYLALHLSGYVNGVSQKHGEVSRELLGQKEIDSITNGVHGGTWVSESFQALYDRYCPGWRKDNALLRQAFNISIEEIWEAHLKSKRRLFEAVAERTGIKLDDQVLTIGFARRSTGYKRNDLIFDDPDTLRRIARQAGAIQLVFAGKAHPKDDTGKAMIQRIVQAIGSAREYLRAVYLPNYDIELGRLITSGCDVWLNNPQPPLEASGTSGMKAALNGVPSLSTLDGWWLEGCFEGVTGWAIGSLDASLDPETSRLQHRASMYRKLEEVVIPAYYRDGGHLFRRVMRQAIAINGSYFNAQRMLWEYIAKAYFPGGSNFSMAPEELQRRSSAYLKPLSSIGV